MSLSGRAYAKINLGLEVLARRDDGYHELRTILQSIDLYDLLSFRQTEDQGLTLECDDPELSLGPSNLVRRAYELVRAAYSGPDGVAIHLDKRIPKAAGLGGGSSDAALTLLALDRLWNLSTSPERLTDWAVSLGMDVPFFLSGGTALATGRGERLTHWTTEPDLPIVLILPEFSISTADAYRRLILTKRSPGSKLQHFAVGDVSGLLSELVNDLEGATGEHSSSIREYKQILLEQGAAGSLMSGSGSAVFGVFREETKAQAAAKFVNQQGIRAVATRMVTGKAYREKRFVSKP